MFKANDKNYIGNTNLNKKENVNIKTLIVSTLKYKGGTDTNMLKATIIIYSNF